MFCDKSMPDGMARLVCQRITIIGWLVRLCLGFATAARHGQLKHGSGLQYEAVFFMVFRYLFRKDIHISLILKFFLIKNMEFLFFLICHRSFRHSQSYY